MNFPKAINSPALEGRPVTAFTETALTLPRCPHCNIAYPSLPTVHSLQTISSTGAKFKWHIYSCTTCGKLVVGGCIYEDTVVRMVFPESEKMQEGLPEKAGHFLKQAIDSIHAQSGAIMLCASSVDAMLKDKGLKKGGLYHRIEEAVKSGLITIEMSEWANEIRLDANDERHADDNAPLPSTEDARRCIDFVRALADFMFVLPARVARGRKPVAPTR